MLPFFTVQDLLQTPEILRCDVEEFLSRSLPKSDFCFFPPELEPPVSAAGPRASRWPHSWWSSCVLSPLVCEDFRKRNLKFENEENLRCGSPTHNSKTIQMLKSFSVFVSTTWNVDRTAKFQIE